VIVSATTPDVTAARRSGTDVAVATGTMTYSDLEKYKPDFIFHDLSDTPKSSNHDP